LAKRHASWCATNSRRVGQVPQKSPARLPAGFYRR
jgi:hypothetical protein